MTSIIKPTDLPDLIRRYQAGATTRELGERYGVEGQSVLARLVKAGVRTRTCAESKALGLPPIDVAEVVTAYNQGQSVNALAERLNVTRGTIVRRLLAAGVQLRSQSEQERLKWKAMTPTQRAAQYARAHEVAAVKLAGRKPSMASLVAKAVMWERVGSTNGREMAVSVLMSALGIQHTPQRRVGAYNIDLAVDAMPVAVEVVSSVTGATYGPKLRKKVIDLLDAGWHVIFVYMLRGNRNRYERIYEDLPAWLDRARRNKSVFGRYGVIRCDSKAGAILRPYLDGLPMVERP